VPKSTTAGCPVGADAIFSFNLGAVGCPTECDAPLYAADGKAVTLEATVAAPGLGVPPKLAVGGGGDAGEGEPILAPPIRPLSLALY
jgi:hypothetical protein